MIALAGYLKDHRAALESDALTLLGMRLDDVPEYVGWDGFFCVVACADERSALNRALNPAYAAFSGPLNTSKLLTDIYDAIAGFIYIYASANSKKNHKPKKPERHPAPWRKQDEDEGQSYGKGAIPKSEFLDWYYGTSEEDE